MTCSYPIYKIQVCDLMRNAFHTDLSETWQIVALPESFPTLKEAENYVIEQQRIHSDMVIYTAFSQNKKKAERDFCFDDDRYLIYRRFFIGPPPIEAIRKSLKNAQIRVIPK